MVRSSHTKSHSATDERDALYKEYLRTTEEFNKVWNKVSLTVDELLWHCKRANNKKDLFKSSLEAFGAVLKALQENRAAYEKAAKAEKACQNHPESKQVDEALEKAQKAKEKTVQDLNTAIKEVVTTCGAGLRHMEEDFGSSSHKEVVNIKKHFEYTHYILEQKSVYNFDKALSYWQQAFQVQEHICTMYDKDKISRLQDETGKLQEQVYKLSVANIHTVESKTQRIEEIKGECRSLMQEVDKTVGHDNYVLSEIFSKLKHFYREVKFAEQNRV